MDNRHIIIFDGVCNFCNGAVNFIIKRDPQNVFVFVPMQSEVSQRIISDNGATDVGFDTFLLVKNGVCFYRTDAALEIAKDLKGYWFLLRIVKILPRPVRDYFYRLLARNRYELFGKKAECMVPDDEVRARFLE